MAIATAPPNPMNIAPRVEDNISEHGGIGLTFRANVRAVVDLLHTSQYWQMVPDIVELAPLHPSLIDVSGFIRDTGTPDQRIVALKDRSGLTWKQLSRVFGVSERAVQGWTAGDRMASKNLKRLLSVEQTIEAFRATVPDTTLSVVFSSGPNGEAPLYATLIEQAHVERPLDSQRAWNDRN